jgi:hypothetical protein
MLQGLKKLVKNLRIACLPPRFEYETPEYEERVLLTRPRYFSYVELISTVYV